jgi:cyclophilin family peptidyl-prolyl cis-trans isomerase
MASSVPVTKDDDLADSDAFLTLSLGDESRKLGTLRIKLFNSTCPRTCLNFATLLRSSPSSSGTKGYRHSTFHRIIPNFMAQGGDYENGDGTGGDSIYGPTFDDENLESQQHSQRGMLAMANAGPNTNGSQFYITFRGTPHLDGKHVVFGQIDETNEESWRVLTALEQVKTNKSTNKPLVPVVITDCGLIELEGEKKIQEAKINKAKLLEKYTGQGPSKGDDADEISLDGDDNDDNEEGTGPHPPQEEDLSDTKVDQIDEKQVVSEEVTVTEAPVEPPVDLTKMTSLQRRMHNLKMKMNQSRQLNRKEVLQEGQKIEHFPSYRKQLRKGDKQRQEAEWESSIASRTSGGDKKERQALSQTATDYSHKSSKKAIRAEMNRYSVDDHYNPEGQLRNYERNVKSVPRYMQSASSGAGNEEEVYNPIEAAIGPSNATKEKAGARRLAEEMSRRKEKSKESREKRDRADFEGDVGYINQRNKRFNEKISRNYDKHTAEIRHNLERGTAS